MLRTALARALPALGAALIAALALLGVVVGATVLAAGALTLLPSSDGGVGGPGAFLALLVAVAAVVLAVVLIVRLALHAAVLAGEPGGAVGLSVGAGISPVTTRGEPSGCWPPSPSP